MVLKRVTRKISHRVKCARKKSQKLIESAKQKICKAAKMFSSQYVLVKVSRIEVQMTHMV